MPSSVLIVFCRAVVLQGVTCISAGMPDPSNLDPRGPDRRPGPAQRQPVFNVPPVTLALVLAILAMFAVIRLGPDTLAVSLVLNLSVVPFNVATLVADPSLELGLAVAASLFGYALVHVDPLHLALNAGFLLAFGATCERSLGRRGMLLLFLLSAAGGALVQIAADWAAPVPVFGASAGVSGCIGGFARLALADRQNPQRRRLAMNLVLFLLCSNVLIGIFGGAVIGIDADIAWEAHLGGFAVGFLVAHRPRRLDMRV